jgi:hypothetical protein
VVLLVVLGAQFMIPPPSPPGDLVTRSPRRPRPVVIPPFPDYPAILRAPIFASDRQPAAAASAAAASQGSLAAYAALGAAVGDGAATVVISGPNIPAKAIKRGDEVEGWRLVAVDHTGATFVRNGKRHTLIIGAPAEGVAPTQGTQP